MREGRSRDDRGIALISVMICIMLCFLLSATIMRVSYLSYLQKSIGKETTKTFYENETYVDDLKLGIQTMVVQAANSVSTSDANPEQVFVNSITGAFGTDQDDIEGKLASFLNADSGIKSIRVLGDGSDYIKVENGGKEIVIKNVELDYEDPVTHYISKIQTDIRIRAPYYDTTITEETTETGGYTMIAGGGSFAFGGDLYNASTGTLRQSGNVYIGYVEGSYSSSTKTAKALELSRRMTMIYEGSAVINGDVYIADNARLALLGDSVEVRGDIYLSSNSKLFLREGTTLKCRHIYLNCGEKSENRSVNGNGSNHNITFNVVDKSTKSNSSTLGSGGSYSKSASVSQVSNHLPYGSNQGGTQQSSPDPAFNSKGPLFVVKNFTPGSSNCNVYEIACSSGAVTSSEVTVTFDNSLEPEKKVYSAALGKDVDAEYARIVDTEYFGKNFDADLYGRNYPSWKVTSKGTQYNSTYTAPDGTTKTEKKYPATGIAGGPGGRWRTIGGQQIQVVIGHPESVDNSHPAFILVDKALYLGDMNNSQKIYGIFLAPEIIITGAKEGTSGLCALKDMPGLSESDYKSFLDNLGLECTSDKTAPSTSSDYRYHMVDNFFHGGIKVLYEGATGHSVTPVINTVYNIVRNASLDAVTFENWQKK